MPNQKYQSHGGGKCSCDDVQHVDEPGRLRRRLSLTLGGFQRELVVPQLLKRTRLIALLVVASIGVVFTPQAWITIQFSDQIYRKLTEVPPHQYGVVFGARVNEDLSLTDVARERVEAAISLYEHGLITKLYISGDNRHNQEAEAIARYARHRGVPARAIVIDRLGIDTQDTCRHFARLATTGILLTQEFHLPRAMAMCVSEGIQPVGVAVNHLGFIAVRGSSVLEIYSVRLGRYLRESLLTWAFLLGWYGTVSNEAEPLE